MALRSTPEEVYRAGGENVVPEVHAVLGRMADFANGIRDGALAGVGGRFTDVVNIGIGGSDLGPRMATRALAALSRRAALCISSPTSTAPISATR